MEWFKKMLGIKRPADEANPFRSPTWDEIMSHRDSQTPKDFHQDMGRGQQDPWGGGYFEGRVPNNDMFSPHQEMFGHIDNMFSMFSHLDHMMRDMHTHPVWTIPDSLEEPDPQTPRDHMLKAPDSDPSLPPYRRDEWSSQGGGGGDDDDDFNPHGPNPFSPHGFFDRILDNFSIHPHVIPFSEGGGGAEQEHSRDSLIKKQDSDLDDTVLSDPSNLPKGGPGYSLDTPSPLPDTSLSPHQHHPGVRQKFYSQSIVTIRRPDGSIEETKKYTDSTGREEVTVTHKQPEEGTNTTTITPLHPGHPSQTPSIFSWFFTR